MRRYWVLAMAATLTACDGGADPQGDAVGNQAQAADSAPVEAGRIPDRFVGVWDADAKSCSGSGSDMRLTIAPQSLTFQNGGNARVASVKAGGDDSVQVDGVVDRDGMTVERQFALSLTPAGKLAVVSDDKTVVRVRCGESAGQPSAAADGADASAATEQTKALVGIAPGELMLIDPNSGRTRHIPFGTPERDVVEALKIAAGAAVKSKADRECDGSPMDLMRFGDGLTISLRNGEFVGWTLNGPSKVSTMSGVGIGSTLAQVQSSYAAKTSDSANGTEFAAGDLHGLLDGAGQQAKTTKLWSGTTCPAG